MIYERHSLKKSFDSGLRTFYLILGDSNWRMIVAWSLLLVGADELNALAPGVLRRWIEHQTFKLKGENPPYR